MIPTWEQIIKGVTQRYYLQHPSESDLWWTDAGWRKEGDEVLFVSFPGVMSAMVYRQENCRGARLVRM